MTPEAHARDDDAPRADVQAFLAGITVPPLGEEVRQQASELAHVLPGSLSYIGGMLGPYRVKALLGRGGQASVFRVEDDDGRAFALKTPHGSLLSRLVREAQILFHLDHPNVLRVEAVDLRGPAPFILTEYLPEGTLADRLSTQGKLAPRDVEALAEQILDALAYAHTKGVVHRDLKPSNILFASDGTVKVADFGIGTLGLLDGRGVAHTLASAERTLFAGTPLYMAPEQEHADPVDGRADPYALGKVLYEALTGLAPRTIKPVSRVVGVSEAWDSFLFRLLEDRPHDRFASADEAKAALGHLRSDSRPRPSPQTAKEVIIQKIRDAERDLAGASGPAIRQGGNVAVIGAEDASLRRGRLVIYEADLERIQSILQTLKDLSKAHCCVLIDVEGHPVARVGSADMNLETLAALVAASFAATREVAKVLGESEFRTLTLEADHEVVRLVRIGRRSLLATIFDLEHTTLGGVGYCVKEARSELERLFAEIKARGPLAGKAKQAFDMLGLNAFFPSDDPNEALDELLDDMFGDV
jgi:serine/threonine protein kinase